MIDRLPGTTIEISVSDALGAKEVLSNIFMCGGLMLSQVAGLTGLEPYVIQNWVKRGFLPPPQKKLYTQRQFCRIAIINMLKDSLRLEKIVSLLSYINGHLDDESDDIIDDCDLYYYYIAAIAGADRNKLGEEQLEERIGSVIADFEEPFPGAKKRLGKVLAVMLNAHLASLLTRKAEEILNTLD